MISEPSIVRVVAFVDGQNLFYAAKEAFGYTVPNYDVFALARKLCKNNWNLDHVRFYTGVPDLADDPKWNQFWAAKLSVMGRQGVAICSRPLRYRNKTIYLKGRPPISTLVGQEKGIDVRIALDIVRLAHQKKFDVALIFSQDQDLSEAADEMRVIAVEQNRWLKAACAYPVSPTYVNKRGINNTDWIKIDRATYDACLDTRDYFTKPALPPNPTAK